MPNRHTTIRVFLSALLTLTLSPAVIASPNCDRASAINHEAYQIHKSAPAAKLKKLLKRALALCPSHPEAHNNLADMLREEGRYAEAVDHYEQALRVRRYFPQAWNGLGEAYYKLEQFPLSLEAHLHVCKTNKESKARIKELLADNRYAITEENQILNKESLLLLYDKTRREEINNMLANCGLRAKMRNVIVFRNLVFNSGKATLIHASKQQLNTIAAALTVIKPTRIKIGGHSDNQRWRGKSATESKRLNLALSQRRANTVKDGLITHGIHQRRVQAKGYGGSLPLVPGSSRAARAKNRRVEIDVR